MKKIIKRILVGVGILLLCMVLFVFFKFMKQGSDMKNITYSKIDISSVADGTYLGTCETSLIQVDVEVVIKNYAIEKITILRHQNGMGASAETIVNDMILQNTNIVDSVSGATMSSEVIQAAVYNAIKGNS